MCVRRFVRVFIILYDFCTHLLIHLHSSLFRSSKITSYTCIIIKILRTKYWCRHRNYNILAWVVHSWQVILCMYIVLYLYYLMICACLSLFLYVHITITAGYNISYFVLLLRVYIELLNYLIVNNTSWPRSLRYTVLISFWNVSNDLKISQYRNQIPHTKT